MEELYMQPIQNNTTYPTVQQINEAQKQKPADNTDDNTTKKQQNKPIQDEYIPSDKEAKQAIGLYQLKYSEDGSPKISFDNPRKKAADNKEAKQEEKKQLEQKLHTASDPKKVKELEQQLAKVEQELQQKDNDTYRRQHTVFSK